MMDHASGWMGGGGGGVLTGIVIGVFLVAVVAILIRTLARK